ncbi:MAG TPA: ABC transporter substrate-binding protein, partial [Aggregatilineaceae bacterium]|nr:ABC transporter substrate-binding protein [Aggregatilineaceae bacterium]
MSEQGQKFQSVSPVSGVSRRDFLRLMSGAAAATVAGGMFTLRSATRSLAADPSGHVSVYSALNESTNNAFIDAFQKAYPQVQVDLLPIAAAGDLQTRIRTEKDSPKADVFIGGSSEFHSPLGKEGLLVPYKSPNASAVDDQFKDPDGYWTGWYIGIFGFVYNTDRFAKEMSGVKVPATWDDLLDPAWKGKLAMPDPVKTGGGYIFLATQIFRFAVSMGLVQAPGAAATAAATMAATAQAVDYSKAEAAALDYMKKLNGNIAQYTGTAPQGIQLVGQGQFVGCPNWSHDILTAKSQKQPVDLAVPAQTGFEIGGLSIVKGGPNLDAAKAFVDWVLSKDGGALNVKLSNRDSVRKDVAPAPGAPTLDNVVLVPYDRAWAT